MGSLASRMVWLINCFTPQHRKISVSAMASLLVEKAYLDCIFQKQILCALSLFAMQILVLIAPKWEAYYLNQCTLQMGISACVKFCQMLFYYCSLIPNHLLLSYFVMVCILPGTSFLLHWLLSSALCISMAKAKCWQYPEHCICAEKQMSNRSLK